MSQDTHEFVFATCPNSIPNLVIISAPSESAIVFANLSADSTPTIPTDLENLL